MARSLEKSLFLIEETWRSEGLATQLAATRQEVADLAPATREVVDLRVRERDARDDTHEAEEKLAALIKRVRMDAVEAERLQKEQDDLFWAIEELRMRIDLAH